MTPRRLSQNRVLGHRRRSEEDDPRPYVFEVNNGQTGAVPGMKRATPSRWNTTGRSSQRRPSSRHGRVCLDHRRHGSFPASGVGHATERLGPFRSLELAELLAELSRRDEPRPPSRGSPTTMPTAGTTSTAGVRLA